MYDNKPLRLLCVWGGGLARSKEVVFNRSGGEKTVIFFLFLVDLPYNKVSWLDH